MQFFVKIMVHMIKKLLKTIIIIFVSMFSKSKSGFCSRMFGLHDLNASLCIPQADIQNVSFVNSCILIVLMN